MVFPSFVDFHKSTPSENLVYVAVSRKIEFLAILWLEEIVVSQKQRRGLGVDYAFVLTDFHQSNLSENLVYVIRFQKDRFVGIPLARRGKVVSHKQRRGLGVDLWCFRLYRLLPIEPFRKTSSTYQFSQRSIFFASLPQIDKRQPRATSK